MQAQSVVATIRFVDVYIEYALLDNFVFDLFLVWSTTCVLKLQTGKLRLTLSALIGAVGAVVLSAGEGSPLKPLLALAMVATCAKFRHWKQFVVALLGFLVATALLGGCIVMVFYLAGIPFRLGQSFTYLGDVPMGVYLLGVFLCVVGAVNVGKRVFGAKERQAFFRKVSVTIDGKTFRLTGYLDSGNGLSFRGKGVCVLGEGACKKRVRALVAEQVFCGTAVKMPVDTVAGGGVLWLVAPEHMEIDGAAADVWLAIGQKTTFRNFDVLLPVGEEI